MDTITKPMNRRDLAKRATKEKALTAARNAFGSMDYNAASIRTLAKSMGMSTGAIFANFESKADLWRQAMGCEPPVDSALTRAAPNLLASLLEITTYSGGAQDALHDDYVWERINEAIAMATKQ